MTPVTAPVAELYRAQGFRARSYAYWRARYHPVAAFTSRLPAEGRLADIGCGHGVLTLQLAARLPGATVVGYEPDARRLRSAQEAGRRIGNARFIAGGWRQARGVRFDAVLLVDVLHHLPFDEHADALRGLAGCLRPGGTLLIHETDPSARWRYWWNYLYDVLLYPKRARCFFRTRGDMAALAKQAGLALDVEPLNGAFGFSTILYAAKRAA